MTSLFSHVHLVLLQHVDSSAADAWLELSRKREGMYQDDIASQIMYITNHFKTRFNQSHELTSSEKVSLDVTFESIHTEAHFRHQLKNVWLPVLKLHPYILHV